MRRFDAIVVGAGPGGSMAAAHLAGRGRTVLLCDRARFPRAKLCGGFLSPESADDLRAEGLDAAIASVSARPIDRVRFVTPTGRTLERPLPATGWAIRRDAFDAALARAAECRGAEVRYATRALRVRATDADEIEVDLESGGVNERVRARAVIDASGVQGLRQDRNGLPPDGRRASGRRAIGERDGDRRREARLRGFLRDPVSPFVAFQRFYRGGGPRGVVEVHLVDGGYCGIAETGDGGINVCFLASSADLRASGGNPEALLERLAAPRSPLRERLRGLRPEEARFRSAGGFRFRRRAPVSGGRLVVGDAAGMIAPLCGDGIAMALQGAALAADGADSFLDGRTAWAAVLENHRRRWRRAFSGRLRTGALLQSILVRPFAAEGLVAVGRSWPGLADHWIRATRGSVSAPGARGVGITGRELR